MNDKQRAQVRLAALNLMDVSYRSGWLSEHVVGIAEPEEYKLKMEYFTRAVRDRKKACDDLLSLVDEIVQEVDLKLDLELISPDSNIVLGVSTDEENLIELGHRDDPESPPLNYRDAPTVEDGFPDKENLIELGHKDDPPPQLGRLLDSYDKIIVRGENAHILEEALGKISEMEGAGCNSFGCNIEKPLCVQMIARRALRDWHS